MARLGYTQMSDGSNAVISTFSIHDGHLSLFSRVLLNLGTLRSAIDIGAVDVAVGGHTST